MRSFGRGIGTGHATDDLVCLLEEREVRELDLGDERSHCANAQIEFHAFPISDGTARQWPAVEYEYTHRRQ